MSLYIIKNMHKKDLIAVSEIEREAFPETWPPTRFIDELESKLSSYFVVTNKELDVIGYVGIWYLFDESHIVSIASKNNLRRTGVGELLLIRTIEDAISRNMAVVSLEVSESNQIAQFLYQKYGFEHVGFRKGYYQDNKENAIIMTTPKIQAKEYRDLFLNLVNAYEKKFGSIKREH